MNAESEKRIADVRALKNGAHVHVSGICGTGMAAVAGLLKERGFRVTGTDKAFYPPMGDVVRQIADKIYEGYSADNLRDRPALVVIGNNLRRDNPEAEYTVRERIPYASMPEVFNALLIGERSETQTSIVVSGTHGKTTTSAAVATMLEIAGRKPGYFIGGVPKDLKTAIRIPAAELSPAERVVVLEGDEYDSAYFAKWPKFHSYRPDILIVTSIEFDHADIYNSVEEIEAEFTKLVRAVPADGLILLCDQSERVMRLEKTWRNEAKAPIEIYGEAPLAHFRLLARQTFGTMQELHMSLRGAELSARSPLSGPQNAQNLLAAAAALFHLKIAPAVIAKGIEGFHGVLRRQHIRGNFDGVTLIEDFAHHPTAVALTLQGLRESYPKSRIICAFEPRSNTTRRGFFQKEYGASFTAANVVCLLDIQDANIYSNTGEVTELLDLEQLVKDIRTKGGEAERFSTAEEMERFLLLTQKPGDVIVCMSNGDFGGLVQALERSLS